MYAKETQTEYVCINEHKEEEEEDDDKRPLGESSPISHTNGKHEDDTIEPEKEVRQGGTMIMVLVLTKSGWGCNCGTVMQTRKQIAIFVEQHVQPK